MRVGEEVINSGDIYELKKPELPLFYTGKETGVHNIKVTFMNSVDNKIVKELKIKYKEFGYTLEVVNAKKNVTQGENVDFSLKITPAEDAPKMDYFIVFKSYDTEKDPKLEKSTVTLNEQKIEFNKEYKIEDLSNVKISTNSFYAGTKELKYVIKNKTFAREETITQEVSQNTLTLSEGTQLSTSSAKAINEKITFVGKITKEPNLSNKIWYKTEITEGQADGLTTNDWTEITLSKENAIENLSFLAKKEGTYKYKITFKDEFGNEISKVFDVELKINKDFSVEVSEGKKNPHQGESVDFKLKVTPAEGAQQSEYFIIFKSYDSADPTLARDYVAFNGHKIEFDKEYKIENLANSRIKLNTFYSGDKELKYIIKNAKTQKEGVITQNVEKNSLVISENAQLSKSVSNIVNETIKFTGKIVKTPNYLNKVWYKTEILSGRFEGLTTKDWTELSLGIDGLVDGISTQLLKEDQYRYKVSFKDEFGNETYKVFDLELKINKDFSVEVSGGKQNSNQGEDVSFKLKVTPAEGARQTGYFIIFKSYDSEDPTLARDYVAFNGHKIEFDKEYEIENLANSRIYFNTFHSGNKQLKYVVKNAHVQKEGTIIQNVQRNNISYELNFDKTETNNVNETLTLRGYVTKTPKYSGKIWYKTWGSSGVDTTNNTYREYNLPDNNAFSINVKTLAVGNHEYYIQFKDEFGNETIAKGYYLKVNNKNFAIEQTISDVSNVCQGQSVTIDFSIRESYDGRYKFKIISFDDQDVNLNKSEIIFNQEEIKLNHIKDCSKQNNRLIVNSFNSGIKKLIYEIYEVSNETNKVRKEVSIYFKPAPILVNASLNSLNIKEGDKFFVSGNVRHLSRTKNIKYRTKVLKNGSVTNEITSTNDNWTDITLNGSNGFQLELNSVNNGNYMFYIQFKDEFGNESEYKSINLNINPKLEIKEFSVNCKITASITQETPTAYDYEFTVSNVSNSKVNIQSSANNKIQKIKIEMPTIEGEFKKEYTFTNVMNIENVFSETHFFFKEGCSEDNYSIELGSMDCWNAIFDVTNKYRRSNVNNWISTRRKAKITVYDSMGNNISKETYINFILDIKGKTESGITYDK